MHSVRYRVLLLALGLLGLIALGIYFWCRGPVYGEIEGRVTQGGQLLDEIEVTFYPDEENTPRSRGLTDKDGHFETMTDAIQKTPARKGAPIGRYRVVLVDRRGITEGKTPKPEESRIPASYNRRLDTPIVDIEIKPGKNAFEFEVR